MFDRFIRLAQAKKALREGRLEEAVRLASDPWIAADRRAEEVRTEARDRLRERGLERLRTGDAEAAVRDLDRVRAFGGDSQVGRELEHARLLVKDSAERQRRMRSTLDEARRLGESGRTRAAEAALESIDETARDAPAIAALRQFLSGRRKEAERLLAAAQSAFASGRTKEALERLLGARSCSDEIRCDELVEGLVVTLAVEVEREVDRAIEQGWLLAGFTALRGHWVRLPELALDPRVVASGRRLARAVLDVLDRHVESEPIDLLENIASAPACPGFSGVAEWERLEAVAPLLLRLPALRARGGSAELRTALEELARLLPGRSFEVEAASVADAIASAESSLAKARCAAVDGDFELARVELAKVLETMPLHPDAQAERELLDRIEREREQRLQSARAIAREGRLREACALALAEASPGPLGNAAAQFAGELRQRMDLVQRGLDEVRAALHGRTSGSVASLRHCLLRLEELAKLQSDHEELGVVRRGIEAEIDALRAHEEALLLLGAGRVREVLPALERMATGRSQLLRPDRLDARILELVDQLLALADRSAAAGRLEEAEACVNGMSQVEALPTAFAEGAERVRTLCAERRAQALAKALAAKEAIDRRDLRAAESACEAARQLWVDGGAPAKLEAELAALRSHEAELVRIEECQQRGDLGSAEAALQGLPPTSPLLRTRIFDMKKSLMKAQGLEGAFLLRVDEGGEFVVVRGDSVTIGNLRDGSADLPILAAVAGRHARIQRSMSFHGGMQDRVVAEGGELRVRGDRVSEHVLHAGDRFQLGSSLQLSYLLPCKRSLTAMLQVHGGFQVAGTDRVLLLKDRGRDGRICLGPGADVHVRVPGATSEVELFGSKTGQVRVRCALGGDIDGRPFQDEHPVDAGVVVRAGGISFVLLPYRADR